MHGPIACDWGGVHMGMFFLLLHVCRQLVIVFFTQRLANHFVLEPMLFLTDVVAVSRHQTNTAEFVLPFSFLFPLAASASYFAAHHGQYDFVAAARRQWISKAQLHIGQK